MKRLFNFCCLMVCLFLFTGCSSKTLKCTRETSYNDEMNMSQQLNIVFKNDHISKLSMNMDVELLGTYMDSRDSLIDGAESEFNKYGDVSGIDYTTKINDSGFNFKVKLNFNKLSEDIKKDLVIANYENSYNSQKKELESTGYSCN